MTRKMGSRLLSLAALGCLVAAPLAQAETSLGVRSASEAKAMYQHDTEACRRGAVDEPRRLCMHEAKRAYQDALSELGGTRHAKAHRSKKTEKTAPTQ